MEQFIKDFWVEIIILCIMGLVIVLKVLKSLIEKDNEIDELYKKHKP
jgi:hypothetical protein